MSKTDTSNNIDTPQANTQQSALAAWLIYLFKAAIVGLAVACLVILVKPELVFERENNQNKSYASAVAAAAPAVVYIYTTKPVSVSQLSNALDRRIVTRREVTNNVGSGVIIREDGLIVTNEHLLRDAQNVYVMLQDGTPAAATVLGIDPDTDLALLDIDATDLPTIEMGRSDTLEIGDVVLAIGNAFGIGQTVTQGIVSATDRADLNLSRIEQFVQTDASINPGNSGGALVDTYGRLVAINSAVINPAGSEGIGFAIPVNLVRGVTEQLLENGRVIRGWLGLAAEPLAPHLGRVLGIENGGIVVTTVIEDSSASIAGLRVGDVIFALDGRPVPRVRDAITQVASLLPGSLIRLSVWRNGETYELDVVVTEQPTTEFTSSE